MEYRFERSGNLARFLLEGRVDAPGAIRLDAAVKEHILPSDTVALFEMERVSYISSAGIRVFSGLEKRLRERNGHLILCAVQPAVGKVLEITGYNRIFSLCSTPDEALHRYRLAEYPPKAEESTGLPGKMHTLISVQSFPDYEAVLRVTGSGDRICHGTAGPGDSWPRIFDASEYSAGSGVPDESAAGDSPQPGPLLTLGGAIFWKPAGSSDPPDFLIPRPDAPRFILHTEFSVATGRQFHEILSSEPSGEETVTLADLCADIAAHARAARPSGPPVMCMVLYAGIREPSGTPESEGRGYNPEISERTVILFGVSIDRAGDLSGYDRDALDAILCQKMPLLPDHGIALYQWGLVFDAPPAFVSRDIDSLVAGAIEKENCTGLVQISPDAQISRAVIGIQYISSVVHADRMPVRILGSCPGWTRTYETLARWLHPGCTELELQPLTGGFSGTLVFRVYARDSRGRLMMPLVMKLGKWDAIEPEIRGYTDHVKRYIQNNATQIIETERIGEYGGILYNFVGIRGAESRIFSLEDLYLSRPPAEILPVFDSLFRIVLKGWYGEPKRKDLPLYREYNRFWKYDAIREYAASHFGATPDSEEIELPFCLGRSTNPLFFVEKIMPDRMEERFPVYESSVHGDLNMKNVLMDETGNLWLIDFAETRYSHILRDITKLEAVIKGEMIPVSSRETLGELCRLDARFLSARRLSEIPDIPASVRDPAMEKAFRIVQDLRRHADRITPGDDDIAQYYLGLLPYTLNLLSYSSVNEYQKEYGWIAASLICRQLMETRQREPTDPSQQ